MQAPAFVNNVERNTQRVKLKVVMLVEPSADEIIKAKPGAPRASERVDHELSDRHLTVCARLVVENMHRTVPDLNKAQRAQVQAGTPLEGMAAAGQCTGRNVQEFK
jgi:hypothetical protein